MMTEVIDGGRSYISHREPRGRRVLIPFLAGRGAIQIKSRLNGVVTPKKTRRL